LLAIATALPWWASIALAIGSFVVLRAVADGRLSLAADPGELSGAMVGAVLLGVGKVGQWILPSVFTLGAALGLVRKRKARGLVDSAASADPRVPRTWREFETLVGEIYRGKATA
jgi:restriction system protein